MAVKGICCPRGRGDLPFGQNRELPFECIKCEDRCYSLGVLAAIIGGVQDRGLDISVTRLLYCLREEYLRTIHDYYINPAGLWAAFRGTTVHSSAESISKYPRTIEMLGIICEERFSETYTINGREVTISGKPDYISTSESLLLDYKTINDKGFTYQLVYGGGDKVAKYQDQLNMYRLLIPHEIEKIQISWLTQDGEFRTGDTFPLSVLSEMTQEQFAKYLRFKMLRIHKGDYNPYSKLLKKYQDGELMLHIPELRTVKGEELAKLKRNMLLRAGVLTSGFYEDVVPARCHNALRKWKCRKSDDGRYLYCDVGHICERLN